MTVALSPKKKLIVYFLSAAVLLLIVNVVIDFLPKEKKIVDPVITKNELERRILKLSEEFSLEKNWVKKIPVKINGKDSLTYVYNIYLPKDIRITDILKRMNTLFAEKEIKFNAKERKLRTFTSVFIYLNGILSSEVNLRKKNDLNRRFATVSFIVKNADELGEEEFNELLSLPYSFCVLISPTDEAVKIKKRVLLSDKQYALYFNDFIDAENYEIAEGLSRLRLKSSVISLVTDFKEAAGFFIKRNSPLYRSLIYNYVRDKFKERGKKLLSLEHYKTLSAKSLKEVKSKFKFYEQSIKGKSPQTFIITAEELLMLKDFIEKYLMRGNKIVQYKY